MGARSAGNPHAACDVEGTGNVARSSGLPARQSSTLPVGAGGGRPPPATRWARRNPRPYRDHAGTFHMTAVSSDTAPPEPVGSMKGLGRIERTDGDVISVRISERKLRSSSAGIHMWLFFQPADERARPWQSRVKVVDPEEQEEAVARLGVAGTHQRGMLVGTPGVETEQDRPIGVDDLPEIVVGRSRLRQAKQRLVPPEAPGHVSHANDCPRALHRFFRGLTISP